jgi:CubicO group peptidase (beta-lactamase class C family)
MDTCGALGTANVADGVPVRDDSVCRIASISKLFTATLAMRLVEEGALQLDTPIATYVPDLPLADARARRRVTLRHLLAHTSGLAWTFAEDHGMGEDALLRAVARFHTLRQATRPGAVWSSSNAGYHLVGALIAHVTGASFDDAMRSWLFDPLGLRSTTYFAADLPEATRVMGYRVGAPGRRGKAPTGVSQYYPRNRNPAGGIMSTTGDLLRFAALHLDDGRTGGREGPQLLHPVTVRAMQERQARAGNDAEWYGLGWALRTVGGVPLIGHAGDTNGFRTRLTLVPTWGFAVVILANSAESGPAISALEAWALRAYCGLRAPRALAAHHAALGAQAAA